MGIRPEDLAIEIAAELEEYSQAVADDLKAEIKEVAKTAVKELRIKSPKDSGEYAKWWRMKIVYESEDDIRVRIFNGKKPQLVHLLEYGHAKGRGTSVADPKPHVRPVEQEIIQKLGQKVKVIVKG